MPPCQEFFQPLIDYLTARDLPPGQIRFFQVYIAGNRAEANPFVLYAFSNWINWQEPVLSGQADQYFSDRVAPGGQPFDAHHSDPMVLSITVPDGPITFTRPDNGALIARFSGLECRADGLLVATSDFSRSIIVVNFVEALTVLL